MYHEKITSIDFIKYILLLILCCYGLSVKAADIYKWVDEKGRVHYSAEPPKDQSTSNGTQKNTRKVETLDSEELKNRNIVPNIVGKRNVPQPIENTDTKQEFQDRSVGETKSISPSIDSSDIALQEMNCEINRRNVEKMQSGDPVFVRDKQGNKVTLDTQQREAALGKAKKNVASFCKPAASSTTLTSSSTKENQGKNLEAENQPVVAEQKRLAQEKEEAENQQIAAEQKRLAQEKEQVERKKLSPSPVANSQAATTNQKTVLLSSETTPIVQNSTKDDGNWYSGLVGIGKKSFKVFVLIVCLILTLIILNKFRENRFTSGLYQKIISILMFSILNRRDIDFASSFLSEGCIFAFMKMGGVILLFCLFFSALLYGVNLIFGGIFMCGKEICLL